MALGAACAASFYWGHHTEYQAALVRQQKAVIAAQQAKDAVIAKAQALGDSLTKQVAQAQGKILKLEQEKRDAIPTLTTGRTQCFSARLVSVLDAGTTGSRVPKTSGKPVAENAADSAASDRDVAEYIASAQSQYATCASRLNSLIDWFKEK